MAKKKHIIDLDNALEEEDEDPPLFQEDDDDLYDPCQDDPSQDDPADSPEPSSLPSLASSHSLSPADTVSFACKRQGLIPVKEKKRPRKPSPSRTKRPSPDQQLDEFLKRGCRCANNCFSRFDREYYVIKRDEANELTREQLDMVVLAQIQACLSMHKVVGPSHKHAPRQRQRTRVSFYHLGGAICRDTFLASTCDW